MKKLTTMALLATPLAFSLAPAAQAQQASITDNKPFSFQIGPGFLTGGKAKDLYSTTGLHLGASYALPIKGLESTGTSTSIDFDYNHNSGSHGHLDFYGLSFTGRIPLTKNNEERSVIPYAGLGIGVWDNMVKYRTSSTTTSNATPVALLKRQPGQLSGGGSSGGSSSGGSSSGGSSSGGTTSTTTTDYSKCGVQIGGKLLLGLAFRGGYFTELSYTIGGSRNGVSPNSLNLAAGIRF